MLNLAKPLKPLSLSIENLNFPSHFKLNSNYRYSNMARSKLAGTVLPNKAKAGKKALRKLLASHEVVPLTTDIWSDRKMRPFLGVTAHVIGKKLRIIKPFHTSFFNL